MSRQQARAEEIRDPEQLGTVAARRSGSILHAAAAGEDDEADEDNDCQDSGSVLLILYLQRELSKRHWRLDGY